MEILRTVLLWFGFGPGRHYDEMMGEHSQPMPWRPVFLDHFEQETDAMAEVARRARHGRRVHDA
ncbi:hypothetical protein [Mesorhizobium sp. M0589]|uniref:hypothetical protein n=1 Tax=Mesorhizobium sp. M0589 TaxID=2956965 RepID=UPI0033366909